MFGRRRVEAFSWRGDMRDRLTGPRPPLSAISGHAAPTRRALSGRRDWNVTNPKPGVRPERPFFSSGPCAKPPGWGPEHLALGSLGRSHRSKLGKARLAYAIELTRKLLRVPATHRIGIVPGSDTGAVEIGRAHV